MRYRADIDGLRALAIVLVVAFHAGVPVIRGGFVGVDVFFVVSGFLITGLLVGELETNGRVSFRDFYARRARRLLPALFVVAAVTLLIGTFVLVPDPELRWLGQSVFATAFFASNIFFRIKTTGYFGADADLQPLLHTWSLAVEEQFYLVWPVLLGLGWVIARRLRRPPRAALITVVSMAVVASFLVSAVGVHRDPSSAFFLLPSRLWELGAGGLLALVLTPSVGDRLSTRAGHLLPGAAIIGLAAIGASAVLLDDASSFPGAPALPVVVGTSLVIVAGTSRNVITRSLGTRPLVALGALSYGWYLIHWPLLVYARIVSMESNLPRDLAICAVALALAVPLYRFVEQPVRLRHVWFTTNQVRTLTSAGLAIVLLGGVGLVVSRKSEAVSQLSITASEQAAMQQKRSARNACPNLAVGNSPAVDCTFNDGATNTIALLGDSHALAILPAAQSSAEEFDATLEMMWTTGCPFIVGYTAPPGAHSLDERCERENDIRMAYLLDNADTIDVALMTGRATSFVLQATPELTDAAAEAWSEALADTFAQLTDAGIDVAIMHDVPRFDHPVPQCLVRKSAAECDQDVVDARTHREPAYLAEVDAATSSGVLAWDPFGRLCGPDVCFTTNGDDVLYTDVDHLSEAGAAFIQRELADLLAAALPSS